MIRLVRALPIAGAAAALVVMVVHAWLALTSAFEVNLVSGVWLALAQDTRDGLFYRALTASGEYGGTRYFPLLFLLAAGFMRVGFETIAAGQVAGVIGGVALATGGYALLARLGTPPILATLGTVLALVPYFVQHSIFAIRAEPLAAGFALWGAAFVAQGLQRPAGGRWLPAAAVAFALAAAAKPTSVYAGLAGVLALWFAGRRRESLRLALFSAAGGLIVIGAIALASEGRAITGFRVLALAGESATWLVNPAILFHPLRLASSSNYLTVTLIVLFAAVATGPRDLLRLPGLMVVLAAMASAVALATPGTILANQSVEPYVAAALYLAWITHARARAGTPGRAVIGVLLFWAAFHNARDVARLLDEGVRGAPARRVELAHALADCADPVLAESPLVPIIAGRRPLMLDPFAFRVAALQQPALSADLVSRLERREFSCVILEIDPGSSRGRGWYANVHFGSPVIEAVLRSYRYRDSVAGRRFYTPAD